MAEATAPNPTYRERREALGLGLREVARRTGYTGDGSLSGINPGRLSIIERGVAPRPDEEELLERVLREAEGAA